MIHIPYSFSSLWGHTHVEKYITNTCWHSHYTITGNIRPDFIEYWIIPLNIHTFFTPFPGHSRLLEDIRVFVHSSSLGSYLHSGRPYRALDSSGEQGSMLYVWYSNLYTGYRQAATPLTLDLDFWTVRVLGDFEHLFHYHAAIIIHSTAQRLRAQQWAETPQL